MLDSFVSPQNHCIERLAERYWACSWYSSDLGQRPGTRSFLLIRVHRCPSVAQILREQKENSANLKAQDLEATDGHRCTRIGKRGAGGMESMHANSLIVS